MNTLRSNWHILEHKLKKEVNSPRIKKNHLIVFANAETHLRKVYTYREQADGYQMGEGWGMGEKGEGLRSTN